jgi:hypothetical protein
LTGHSSLDAVTQAVFFDMEPDFLARLLRRTHPLANGCELNIPTAPAHPIRPGTAPEPHLEHHGLNRCLDVGLAGYLWYVGYGVMSYNLHVIGRELLAREWARAATVRRAG